MNLDDIPALLEEARILFPDLEVRTAERDRYPNPARDGVFLKDLETRDTDGAFSHHLVRVGPLREVAEHDLGTQWEWNVIPGGAGSVVTRGRAVPTAVGQTFVAPPHTRHTVRAGKDELSLLALFVPALG